MTDKPHSARGLFRNPAPIIDPPFLGFDRAGMPGVPGGKLALPSWDSYLMVPARRHGLTKAVKQAWGDFSTIYGRPLPWFGPLWPQPLLSLATVTKTRNWGNI